MDQNYSKQIKDLLAHLREWVLAPARKCTLFFVVGVAAWLLTFNLTKWTVDGWWEYLPILLVDLYLVALVVCLLPRGWRQAALALIYVLIYLGGFCESFLYQRFFMHFTPQTLTMVLETNEGETSGFLDLCWASPRLWETAQWWLILLSSHLVVLVGKLLIAWRWPRLKQQVQKWAPYVMVPVCVVSLWWWVPNIVGIAQFMAIDRTDKAEQTGTRIFYSTAWRVAYSFKFEQLSRAELYDLAYRMNCYELYQEKGGVPTIVLVIGESYNKHHSAVYGYELPTTPFQSQLEDDGFLVAMDDAVTPWNVTSSVFKFLMSTHSSDKEGLWTDGILFPAVLRKGGYKTAFISNQFYKSKRQNSANYNGSFYLNSQPFDSLCFDYRNTKFYKSDAGLLKELKALPKDSLQFVIFHMLGQHMPYAERVTDDSREFKESDINRPDLAKDERQIVADYDNATLANDRVIQQIYEYYQDRPAVIVYVADHGDEVYDGNIGMYGRNHSAELTPQILRGEFEVPFEVMITPPLMNQNPSLITKLRNAKSKAFSTDDLCHMLMGLAKVIPTGYDYRRDLLNSHFQERPRPLKGTRTTYEEIMGRKEPIAIPR